MKEEGEPKPGDTRGHVRFRNGCCVCIAVNVGCKGGMGKVDSKSGVKLAA